MEYLIWFDSLSPEFLQRILGACIIRGEGGSDEEQAFPMVLLEFSPQRDLQNQSNGNVLENGGTSKFDVVFASMVVSGRL